MTRFKNGNGRRGVTVLGAVVATTILALVLVSFIYVLSNLFARYATIAAQKAIFPLADELRTVVTTEMKNYFTRGRPPTPCSDTAPLTLRNITPLRSGASLDLLTKSSAAALPQNIPGFSLYNTAVAFCGGTSPVAPATLRYYPAEFPAATPPWDIFNPPGADFKLYTTFDFCGTISCAPSTSTPSHRPDAGHNKICQFAVDPQRPILVVMRYQILNAQHSTPYTCYDTLEGWPKAAVGKLTYLFLWSRAKADGTDYEFYVDAGIYHANKAN